MNLPSLIHQLYGEMTFTGLYSFEFVDKNRNTITEIFLMLPPKRKTVDESTRSTTVPTLSGNYNNDAGNSTKTIMLSGKLHFPYIGSPDNPIARDNSGLANTIDGLNEFFKLRWMLIRYRDYTMTKKAKMTVPTELMGMSNQISALYNKVSKSVKKKLGALYDEVQLIFHDYDMDDHFYCRVDNFHSEQADTEYLAVSYTINIECYEPNSKRNDGVESAKTTNEIVNVLSNQIVAIGFDDKFDAIQADIGYNANFVSASVEIDEILELIQGENDLIQAGKSTASTNLPIYVNNLLRSANFALAEFLDTFLSNEQQTTYLTGSLTFDDVLDIDLISFYNTLQKVKLLGEQFNGLLSTIVKSEEIRYYANADNYTLTEEQFDSGDENKIENDVSFYFYTVMDGDTSRVIALRELQDQEKFINILQLNEITENDFIDGSLIGKQIKIPLIASAISRGGDNLVYEPSTEDIKKFLYGSDIATGINNQISLSPTGDLETIDGIDNVMENIEKRIVGRKGSLNVFNPGWGTISVDDSNAPFLVKIERYLSDVIEQIQSDPRVETVKMDLSRLTFEGEAISVPTKVFFVGSEESREVMA